jgi:hypothetical protein
METFNNLGDMLLRRYVTDFIGNINGMSVKKLSSDILYDRTWDEDGKESLQFHHLCDGKSEKSEVFLKGSGFTPTGSGFNFPLSGKKKNTIDFHEGQKGKCAKCDKEFLSYKKMEFAANLREFKK